MAPATVVVFVVGSDAPATRPARMNVRVRRTDSGSVTAPSVLLRTTRLRPEGEELFSVVPSGEPRSQPVEVVIEASLAATATQPTQMLRRSMRFAFVPNARLVQRVFLSLACLNASTDCQANSVACTVQAACEERGLTCGDDGECVALAVVPRDVGDASVRFDAARDSGVTVDATDVVRDSGVRQDVTVVDVVSDTGVDPCADAGVGTTCTPPALCRAGAIQCVGGTGTCVVTSNLPAGTPCGGGRVCTTAGACEACASGMACVPSDPCRTGMISCGAGTPTCVAGGPRPAGASCGANRVCSPSGTCVSCVEGASCTSANPCATATLACGGGSPVCVDRGSVPDATACGTGRVCSSGSCRCNASSGCPMGQLCVQGTCAPGSRVPMFTCPFLGGGTLGGGTWGYYGCVGQTWSNPSCVTIESPRNRADTCNPAGQLQLTQSPVAPLGATAVPLYRCPVVSGGALGGGAWGYYECHGQLSSNSTCLTIESPTMRSSPCTMQGYVTVYPSAPPAPPGGRTMQVFRCPSVGGGALGGGSWGYYGCRGQLGTTNTCTTLEYPRSRTDPCPSAGHIVLE